LKPAIFAAIGWNSVVPRSYQSLESTLTPSDSQTLRETTSVSLPVASFGLRITAVLIAGCCCFTYPYSGGAISLGELTCVKVSGNFGPFIAIPHAPVNISTPLRSVSDCSAIVGAVPIVATM